METALAGLQKEVVLNAGFVMVGGGPRAFGTRTITTNTHTYHTYIAKCTLRIRFVKSGVANSQIGDRGMVHNKPDRFGGIIRDGDHPTVRHVG